MMNPKEIKHIVLDGHSLTLESFVAVARYNATVELADSALEAMKKSRALAEKIAEEGRVAYGITTGFGDFQKVAVPEEMSNQLSTNLILSHCTGAGEPYTEEVVRGMLLLRANALCGGVSGVRPLLVEMMIEMLNKGVHPWVPQKGSLGSSGDLAPLAHMTLPMLGKGQAYYKGELMSGADAMAKAGIATLDTLVCKEGLGMTNGTCAMTSVGSLALYDTICAAQLGDVIGSMAGKSIEIGSTDAEGRLILADAITYAITKEGAAKVEDIATLTGAIARMLGGVAAGVMANDDSFYGDLQAAAGRSGEKFWRMPDYPEYKKLIESPLADLYNSSNDGCGAIAAGMFLSAFAGDTPWLHLDIAGTAWNSAHGLEYQGKGATGMGVTTLYELCRGC